MKDNFAIIMNPVSGGGAVENRRELLQAALTQLDTLAEIIETQLDYSAELIARDLIKSGKNHLVVCGGDGTIREVLDAVVGTKVVLGIVPMGTGNLFAKNLNIPEEVNQAMHTAIHGTSQKIDLGKANGKHFAIMAGIGLDAAMIHDAKRELKTKYGYGAYIASAIKNIPRPRDVYAITIDGKPLPHQKAKSVLVANLGKLQGGLEVVPDANPQTGSFKVGVIKAKALTNWMSIVFHSIFGQIYNSPHYDIYEGKHIEITSTQRAQPIQCDGNDFPPTHSLIVDVLPKAITVLTNR